MSMDFSYFLLNRSAKGEFTANDACRMAAYFLQDCNCYVTGTPLLEGKRQLHHRILRSKGGKDNSENLILLNSNVHLMVHAETQKQFQTLLDKFPLTREQLQLVNQLRYQAYPHRAPIDLNTLSIPKSS